MHRRHTTVAFTALALLVAAGFGNAQTPRPVDPATGEQMLTKTEVTRAESKGPRRPSLQFLRDNRVFLRAQLDRLRLQTTLTRDGDASLLDERWLRLQELAAAIAAARDTVAFESGVTERQHLLDSVAQLSDLENQLFLMENLVVDQQERLQVLEDDFLGRQETALVVLVRGLPADLIPDGLSLAEDNELLQVPLDPTQQLALREGGVAQISHRLVEPREHFYSVGFSGPGWQDTPPVAVAVTAARDRITFLELDLSQLTPNSQDSGLDTKVWQR